MHGGIYLPPTKVTYYSVVEKPTLVRDMLVPIAKQVILNNKGADKTIIYCRRLSEVADVYEDLKLYLRHHLTFPESASSYLQKYCLVDMHTSCIEKELKAKIVQSFVDSQSNLCVVVASSAFGMGLDCECVRAVVHWGGIPRY